MAVEVVIQHLRTHDARNKHDLHKLATERAMGEAAWLFLQEHRETMAEMKKVQDSGRNLSLEKLTRAFAAEGRGCGLLNLTFSFDQAADISRPARHGMTLSLEFEGAAEEEACLFVQKIWEKYRFHLNLQALAFQRERPPTPEDATPEDATPEDDTPEDVTPESDSAAEEQASTLKGSCLWVWAPESAPESAPLDDLDSGRIF